MFTLSMYIRRRGMLVGLGFLAASPALAKTPLSGGQVAGVHRYKSVVSRCPLSWMGTSRSIPN